MTDPTLQERLRAAQGANRSGGLIDLLTNEAAARIDADAERIEGKEAAIQSLARMNNEANAHLADRDRRIVELEAVVEQEAPR